jgi:hypothetical protein
MSITVDKDEADKTQFDATQVRGQDPNYVYRWARCRIGEENDSVNLATHEMHGYEVVSRKDESSILNSRTRVKKGADTDDTIRWGDMILMRIPKDMYEARRAAERAKILRQTKGVAEAYKASIAQISQSDNNAYEEHRDNPSMSTVSPKEEKMTQQQLDAAMKIASGIEEDLKEE